MSGSRPEPNFARLVTEDDLRRIVVSAHALRRFVERLQPGIPGADHVAQAMARLEDLGSGNRSGPEQGQLNRYRDWMTKHIEPVVLDAIRCEGFWATDRPRWSLSRTPSDSYLQVGRMCLWPVAEDGGRLILTTCTNGRDTTWDTALARGFTLMPRPYATPTPELMRPPSWATIALRAWRSRQQHGGFFAALRTERSQAIESTRLENQRRAAESQSTENAYQVQRENAQRTFRERHLQRRRFNSTNCRPAALRNPSRTGTR